MSGDDPALRSWREHFNAAQYVGFPNLRPIATMQEVQDKLVAALNVLESVADDDEAAKQKGLALATMAMDFGCKVLCYLNVLDEGPTPKPLNIKMAQVGLSNLVTTIHEEIMQHRHAMQTLPGQDDADEIKAIEAVIKNEECKPKPIFHPDQFSVEWKGKFLNLGNTLAYHLFERLCQSPGKYIKLNTLIQDVWKGKAVSDEAVQKQVSSLRRKLADAGFDGITFDGDEPKHYRLILG